ncbi:MULTISPECIES: ribonuclease HII [unclassified Imperialibacter]|uniref:ribonuclease HII n=1 Tax=unclassified Imperialibacter TaxID=2629706 RepID=UPI00125334E7|nr:MULTISPECIES: ribonuclease HII [unclassified Imperialibacter]CAD5299556.1 ribonuclease HII, degrades RNA of DNA-RNA hybrids [Imperialibacter sp. 89]CAD5300099.1 ribonuclease HII, degrades RNA of DNA-RNA hybrids [Imperialibacter sp. 75]VVT15215.1 ribonuclease HII, degrades RNA of DNA-RNA hybrids [Imperialibacter sp. EC-SDR9]
MLLPFFNKGVIEAGCDEAGRGCLAGPVVAAAVTLPPDFHHKVLTDSKQLSEKQRMALKEDVKSAAVAWAIGWCSPEEIDKINILNASFVAMHRAVDQLKKVPEHLLIDGNRFKKYKELPHNCIIKGDSLYYSIAAASILAKTYRDEWMERLGEEFPVYQWAKNKGYPTMDHRAAIRAHGITPYHRKSFRLLPEQMELFK